MNTTPYTYSVIRYLHDPATGEMLNIGVILCAPAARVIEARLEYRYERLSDAFVDFDGDHYRRTLHQFTQVLDVLRERLSATTLFDLWDISSNAQSIAKQIWPDMDLSFQIGEVMAGISDDLSDTIESLFHRMVTSQYQRATQERRTDDEVWSVYQKPLVRRHVVSNLRPTVLTTPEVTVKFAHAFRNEKWHVLQPLSMDLKRGSTSKTRLCDGWVAHMLLRLTRSSGHSMFYLALHQSKPIGRPTLRPRTYWTKCQLSTN